MTTTDPIADMLTRIRNAIMRKHQNISLPHSSIKEEVLKVLKEEGYIEDYQVLPEKPQAVLRIRLKYVGDRRHRRPLITGIQRVSRPGRRIYVGSTEIPWVLSGMGIAVLTTPQGIMTGHKARRLGIGGEVLCKVW